MTQLCHAWMCSDCEEIFDSRGIRNGRCPRCGSEAVAVLAKWVRSLKAVRPAAAVTEAA